MLIVILFLLVGLLVYLVYARVKIKATSSVSHKQPAPETSLEAKSLYRHVQHLTVSIGSRSIYEYDKIRETEDYIKGVLKDLGLDFSLQTYECSGRPFSNIIVTLPGQREAGQVFIIGGHYDTVFGTPGADDNASAVAVLLELCRILKSHQPARTLKLIFFVLEEPPSFRTSYMGSYVYAKEAKKNDEKIYGMISLEMLGYYNDVKGAQTFPLPLMSLFYPATPHFIAVVGNIGSRRLVKRIANSIKKASTIPVETLATVKFVPGVDFSDHASFWRMGYPAVMLTDTAFYRNPNYHTPHDTIDTLDFEKMAELLKGLVQVAKGLT